MRRAGILLCIALATSGVEANGQLISPGRLSEVHADLEGLRRCTTCHQLRSGVPASRCLGCHVPLAERISAELGYHARLDVRNCATCHKEHFGREFDVRRFDEQTFSHDSTGFSLKGAHQAGDCRACHAPNLVEEPGVVRFKSEHGALSRTYLGLPNYCAACHVSENPHDGQFSDRGCVDCHDEGAWEGALSFDHDSTPYPLEGAHRGAECASCHGSGTGVLYRSAEAGSCASCHDDPHTGRMDGSCSDCHSVVGWHRVEKATVEKSFDHSRTEFALSGAHAGAECGLCHTTRVLRTASLHISPRRGTESRTYPKPVSATCASCHVDVHTGELDAGPSGGICEACHGDFEWVPSAFGLARHDQDTAFPLTGAHVTTPCGMCHMSGASETTALSFGAAMNCVGCHQADDPHQDQFGDRECSECHVTDEFTIQAFDHDSTTYPLDGAHSDASCLACHEVERWPGGQEGVRYRPLGSECTSCHEEGVS